MASNQKKNGHGLYLLGLICMGYLLFVYSCSEEENIYDPYHTIFVQRLKVMQEEEKIPGLSYVIFSKERIIHSGGLGYANLIEEKRADQNTIYHWMSLSKLIAATGLMQLVEQGKVQLEDKVSDYIAEFNITSSCETIPCIKDFTTHSSGLDEDLLQLNIFNFPGEEEEMQSVSELAQTQFDKNLIFCPGSQIFYSNMNYAIIGHLIEVISGLTYMEYVQQNIFSPLSLKNSYFYFTEQALLNAAMGHEFNGSIMILAIRAALGDEYDRLVVDQDENYQYLAPYNHSGTSHGGLIGTADDYARFVMDQFSDTSLLLGYDYRQQMHSIQQTDPDNEDPYKIAFGIGWNLSEYETKGAIGHTGSGPGFANKMLYFPKEDLGIIVLTNVYLESKAKNGMGDLFFQTYILHE